MATATENQAGTETATDLAPAAGFEATLYPISCDLFERMVELEVIPEDRRVFLWDGRLYEKMAKSKHHGGAQITFNAALVHRLPPGYCVANENPVQLDPTHLPLPDLVVLRGEPITFFDRYPDGRDVVFILEVAVTSLARDLGVRRSKYALTLPGATYVVADTRHRKLLVHRRPGADPNDPSAGSYAELEEVGPGGALRLAVDGVDLAPIPYEELMR